MKPQKNKKAGRSNIRLKKRSIKITGKWKPVSLDPNLFGDAKIDDVICFEELTDYKLVNTSRELATRGQKRKHDSDGKDEGHSVKSKKNMKKTKLEVHKFNAESEDDGKVIFTGEEDVEVVDEIINDESVTEAVAEVTSVKPANKKKRKRKNKVTICREDAPDNQKSTNRTRNWTSGTFSSKIADVSSWKDLSVPQPVLQALSCLGFSAPTPIQALVLPSAIRDKMDVLGAAETGSGKTLAFAIPMIHSILEWRKMKDPRDKEENNNTYREQEASGSQEIEEEEDSDDEDSSLSRCVKAVEDVDTITDLRKKFQCDQYRPLLGLVVTPTRELAVQVKHHIDAVTKFTAIRTTIIVGGMASQKQERVLNSRPEIVIATPGRLWEMITCKHPHLSNLRQLRCLVIDEADRMVEKGHYAELAQLLEMLRDSQYNPKRQTFIFSATLTLVHQAPARLLQKKTYKKMDRESKLEALMAKVGLKGKPKVIDLTKKQATVETLTETTIHCATNEKDFYLYYFLLQYPGRTMVFANSIDCIKRLTSLLTILECNPLPLHANMHQKQRLKNLERFAERESCVLLTTDVAARGLDVPNVQHVLHYQVPRTSETYVHRSGRTARASSDGLSLLLIGPDDVINYKNIFRTLEKTEELPVFPVESKCMAGIKERVNLARQIEKIEYFNSKAKQQNSWLQQAAEALDMDLDEDLMGKKDEQEDRQKHKALKLMKKQLKKLLNQPVFRNFLKTKYPTQSGQLSLPSLPASRCESALHTLATQNTKRSRH